MKRVNIFLRAAYILMALALATTSFAFSRAKYVETVADDKVFYFTHTGAEMEFTSDSSFTPKEGWWAFVLRGGQGGKYSEQGNGQGGAGGVVIGMYQFNGSTTINIYVGQGGQGINTSASYGGGRGFGGGGNNEKGAGGGGASIISDGAPTLSSVIAVAGGGGGGGATRYSADNCRDGGDAGGAVGSGNEVYAVPADLLNGAGFKPGQRAANAVANRTTTTTNYYAGGGGGSDIQGGIGGGGSVTYQGSFLKGGDGNSANWGGGGGSGYYGGGGSNGSANGGGGGGSSWNHASVKAIPNSGAYSDVYEFFQRKGYMNTGRRNNYTGNALNGVVCMVYLGLYAFNGADFF